MTEFSRTERKVIDCLNNWVVEKFSGKQSLDHLDISGLKRRLTAAFRKQEAEIEEWKEYSEKLRLALKEISDHKWAVTVKNTWANEFVDVAKEALLIKVPGEREMSKPTLVKFGYICKKCKAWIGVESHGTYCPERDKKAVGKR